MQDTSVLLKSLNLSVSDTKLLNQAFIHRSYLNESKKTHESNERLEFLGDSILSYLVSLHLYSRFPELPEGELTNLRSSLVKTSTLASVSLQLHLGDYLLLSKGEEESGGRSNPSLLADTFEAFLGALFLTSDIAEVKKILDDYLFPKITSILESQTYKDPKSMLQELVQEDKKISPLYKVLKEEGPDHAKQFLIGVYVESQQWGAGSGKSKQEAEQEAARVALEKWKQK